VQGESRTFWIHFPLAPRALSTIHTGLLSRQFKLPKDVSIGLAPPGREQQHLVGVRLVPSLELLEQHIRDRYVALLGVLDLKFLLGFALNPQGTLPLVDVQPHEVGQLLLAEAAHQQYGECYLEASIQLRYKPGHIRPFIDGRKSPFKPRLGREDDSIYSGIAKSRHQAHMLVCDGTVGVSLAAHESVVGEDVLATDL